MVELTFLEGARLIRVLRLAFPSRSALKQVVFTFLGGEDLDAIAEDDTYVGTLVRLIAWTETQQRTPALIDGARKINPGNDFLQEFEADYNQSRPAAPGGTAAAIRALSHAMRAQLVAAICRLPVSGTYAGRSVFLAGIPASLNRDENNAQVDLDGILNQLDGLGRMTSGAWPLLVFIDNALRYAAGFEPELDLQAARQAVAQAYGVQ